MPLVTRDLAALPKAHLHMHLEAGMRPETLVELGAKHGVSVPVFDDYSDFTSFSATYTAATQVLRTAEDWTRLADETCADHAAQGAFYVEPSFWPRLYEQRFGSSEACWECVLNAFAQAGPRHGVIVRLMAAIDRVHDTPEQAERVVRLAIKYQEQGIVSVGLHNDEVGHPPGPFAPPFALAKAHGLRSAPHAGELDHGQRVAEALEALDADRIQHGIRATEVPGLLARLAEAGTCLDVCPTSNVRLGVVASIEEHPLPLLLDAGVRCSVNADDPLLFGVGILDEYRVCRTRLGLTDAQIANVALDSVEASMAPARQRDRAVAAIRSWLDDGDGTA